ncbi:MAG: STAS domain-containing protein [bacterium]|nr:STAS domain-containing protein [Gemmatimonadota bacterium]
MADTFQMTSADSPPSTALLRLEGRLDARNAQTLVQECQRLRDAGRSRIVVNLSRVAFVASSGVGSLLALTEMLNDANGKLVLVDISDAVRSVVELLNLTQFLNLQTSEAEAFQTIGV